MIVGIKTVRFITVQRHTDPAYGFIAYGVEETFELHATKGWKYGRRRRQLIGPCERRDVHRAVTQGASVTFKRAANGRNFNRRVNHGTSKITPIPITEKMLMRHAWYRRKKGWDNYRASLPAAHVHPDYHTEAQRAEARDNA